MGLLAGGESVTMSGGNGTVAADARLFGEANHLQVAMEEARLLDLRPGPGRHHRRAGGGTAIVRHNLMDTEGRPIADPTAGEHGPDDRRPLSPESFFETAFLILLALASAAWAPAG